jgi:hypothetical protein
MRPASWSDRGAVPQGPLLGAGRAREAASSLARRRSASRARTCSSRCRCSRCSWTPRRGRESPSPTTSRIRARRRGGPRGARAAARVDGRGPHRAAEVHRPRGGVRPDSARRRGAPACDEPCGDGAPGHREGGRHPRRCVARCGDIPPWNLPPRALPVRSGPPRIATREPSPRSESLKRSISLGYSAKGTIHKPLPRRGIAPGGSMADQRLSRDCGL